MRSSACYRSSRVRQPRPYGRGFFISWLYASDDSKHATGVELNTLNARNVQKIARPEGLAGNITAEQRESPLA